MKRFLIGSVVALALAGTAAAGPIASSNFSTGDDGWLNGNLDEIGSTSAVTYDSINHTISVVDNYGYNAFVAPTSYTGNQSAALGGTLSYTLTDVSDLVPYSPLALIGTNGDVLYADPEDSPDPLVPFSYSVKLVSSNFFSSSTSGPYVSTDQTPVSEAEFESVLSSLASLNIQADWHTGSDDATLYGVTLSTGGAPVSGAPEPANWALMLGGVGVLGGVLRVAQARRREEEVAA